MNNDTKPICKISLHQSLPLISDATPKWSQAACLCGLYFLYYVFAFIFWHPKKELFLKMCSLAFSSTGQKNNQAPNPPLMKTECTEVRYGCCQAKTANYTIPGKNSNDRRLKNKPFFLANDGKRHMNRTRDKRQKLWQGMNLPCWVMKLNDSSWARKGCWERERARERGVGGFCPARKLKPSQANWVQVLLVGKSRPINLAYYSVPVSLTEGHLGIQ